MKAENCRICKGSELSVILDYGNVALADSFLNSKNEIINEKKYPLKLCFCENCKHLQIDEIIPPELLFKNYVYETGVSKSILGFADDLCQKLLACYYANSPQKQPAVLEIASNDGTVLSVFQDNGCKVLGIDPAENIVKIANSRGVKSLASFFNLQNANKILEEYGKWNICLARNVLAHVNELHSLVNGIKTVLADDGFAIVEVPHIKTMFEQLQYDQVFHEHIGFHSFDSVQRLFNMFEMETFDVEDQVEDRKASPFFHLLFLQVCQDSFSPTPLLLVPLLFSVYHIIYHPTFLCVPFLHLLAVGLPQIPNIQDH